MSATTNCPHNSVVHVPGPAGGGWACFDCRLPFGPATIVPTEQQVLHWIVMRTGCAPPGVEFDRWAMARDAVRDALTVSRSLRRIAEHEDAEEYRQPTEEPKLASCGECVGECVGHTNTPGPSVEEARAIIETFHRVRWGGFDDG